MVSYTEILADMKRAMASLGPDPLPRGPIHGSASLFSKLDYFAPKGKDLSYSGIQIKPNNLFPYEVKCATCGGTGDGGTEATYCPKCKGQGANRYEGCMTDGERMVVITSPLPKKFAPSWPGGIAVPRRPIPDYGS